MSETDLQLLTRYTSKRAEDAFAEIVRRHVDLVHSAALRQVRSPELAEEVAQTVFTELARRAGQLPSDTVVGAWLYNQTRRRAIDVVRREAGRRLREQTAQELQSMNATAEDWTHIEPLLDEAMEALEETDRLAVLLRYFQNKPLREVGEAIGISDDAAQKRVSRAVDRLREFFGKRGVAVGGSGLVILISTNAVLVAPTGLSAAISTSALAGTTFITTTTATVGNAIAMTTTQKVLVTVALAAAMGNATYQARQASTLRSEVQSLRQFGSNQVQQLTIDPEDSARQIAALRAENERLKRDTAELSKLRGEVASLRTDAKMLAELKKHGALLLNADDHLQAIAANWAKDATQLKQRLAQMPQFNIPEIALLDDFEWLRVADELGNINDEDDVREVLSELRLKAKQACANYFGAALWKYARANDGQIPNQISDLKPFFQKPDGQPVDEAILQRYELVQAGKLADAPPKAVIAEKAAVDKENDTLMRIGPRGFSYEGLGPRIPKHGEGGFSRRVN
jgi:RNA polymerase sigma factor (sigma-70 family)